MTTEGKKGEGRARQSPPLLKTLTYHERGRVLKGRKDERCQNTRLLRAGGCVFACMYTDRRETCLLPEEVRHS